METTIVSWGHIELCRDIVPLADRIFGLYWDNGTENGNYFLGFRV